MTTWAEIAERCQNASDGDDNLEADVWFAAGQPLLAGDTVSPPPYSTSVDAVLGLVAEKFPEWFWRYEDAIGTACLIPDDYDPDKSTDRYESGVCSTPALALLAAFALAMQAEEGVQGLASPPLGI